MAETILKDQSEISKQLETFERNYRKDGTSRKSDEELGALNTMFRVNHRQLLGLLKVDTPYFDVQEEVETKFEAIKNMIKNDQAPARKSASENEGGTAAMNPRGNANNGGSA